MFEKEAEEYVDNNFYDLIEEVQKVAKVTFKDGAEFGYDKGKSEKIAELEKQISNLLSCKDCPDNKGGYICEKECNDKCLAQKIQYIKELKEENNELKEQIEKMKADVKGNIKWADWNKNDQMWQKLVKMYNQWS